MRHALLLTSVALAVTAACSSKSSTTGPKSGTTTTGPNGAMTASIDGAAWSATGIGVSYQNGQGSFILTGSNGTQTVGLGVLPTAGAASYTLTAGSGVTGSLQATVGGSAAVWQANGLGAGTGAGTVTLTTLTAHSASGTFTFTLVAQPFTAATGARAITQGAFSVTF